MRAASSSCNTQTEFGLPELGVQAYKVETNASQRERRYMHAGPGNWLCSGIVYHPLEVTAAPTLASLPSRFASNRSKMRLTLS